tara:strand:- start:1691 stop:2212 length:522 start_codon:yes stop_codon:yes gene_type:complete
MIFWFTGLSGSGKTTFSKFFINKLNKKMKKKVIHIDGDSFRTIFNDLRYSLKDRIKNSERVCKLANFLNKSGKFIIVVSMVSISPKWLNWIRVRNTDYFQIFLDVPITILKARNSKNIYKKKNIVGVDIRYLKPIENDFIFKNDFKLIYLKNSIDKILKNKKIQRKLKIYDRP